MLKSALLMVPLIITDTIVESYDINGAIYDLTMIFVAYAWLCIFITRIEQLYHTKGN